MKANFSRNHFLYHIGRMHYSYEHLLLDLLGWWRRREGLQLGWPRCGRPIPDLLPRRQRFEVAECLGELEGFINNAFALFIIAQLGVSGQREIFPQGVSLEAVIGENTTQIWVTTEEHPVHVPYLPLIPIRASEQASYTGDVVGLASIGLDPDPALGAGTQKMVHDLEALLALWKIDGSDLHQVFELALRVVAQEGQERNDGGGRGIEGELVLDYRKLLDEFREALGEVGAICVECACSFGVLFYGWVGGRGLREGRGGGADAVR